MKSYFAKGRNIERAQEAERKHPDLQPETEYCLPGSQFARMMRLARAGASDELFKRKIRGIDRMTIRVARKIANGTISTGDRGAMRRKSDVASMQEEIFQRFAEGASNTEVQVELGLAETSVRFYRRMWRAEQSNREAEAEGEAG